MKKIISLLIAAMMLLPAGALCEEAADTAVDESATVEAQVDAADAVEEETPWYSLSEDGTALTITLESNASTGYEWTYEASDEALEEVTSEYIEPEATDMLGVPGQWVISFKSAATAQTDVELTLKYARGDEFPAYVCDMALTLNEDGTIAVNAAAKQDNTWLTLSDDGTGLSVSLEGNATTGYDWSYVISDESLLTAVSDEYVEDEHEEGMTGVGGTWNASFASVAGKSGEVTLTLNYARSWEENPIESYDVALNISEDGTIEILSANSIAFAAE